MPTSPFVKKITIRLTKQEARVIDIYVEREGFETERDFIGAAIMGWAEWYKCMAEIKRLREEEAIWTQCSDYKRLAHCRPPIVKRREIRFYTPFGLDTL